MSLTADTSHFTEFKLPPVFKGNPGNYNNEISNSSLNYNSSSSSRTSSSVKYQLSYGTKLDFLAGDVSRNEPRIRMSGIKYLKSLPFAFARKKEAFTQDEDSSKRPAFPEAASVSLPTSTTTLEYLLHKRSSRLDAADESDTINSSERTQLDNVNSPRELLRARSTSFASYISPDGSSDEAVRKLFNIEPCLYTHQMFMRAAMIKEYIQMDNVALENAKFTKAYGATQNSTEDASVLDFENTQEEITTLELAFETLKYEKLFEEALEHTEFFLDYAGLYSSASLVHVILYDVQSRKFQKRAPFVGEVIQDICNEIEEALIARKTRLQSYFAKIRIKHNATSIEYILPDRIRNMNKMGSEIPVYMWVNQVNTTIEGVIGELEAEGFTKLSMGETFTGQTGKVFMTDSHCSDLLVFPPYLNALLKETKWVLLGQLVEQDKSSCMAAQSVQYLLGMDKDVIHVNVGSGLTTAHLLSLLHRKSPKSRIWGFGIDVPCKGRKTMKNIDSLGATKYTKFLLDDFLSVDPEEPKLKSVKVILITANCSKSGITNPVRFLVTEGEDIRILGDIAKGATNMDNIDSLVAQNDRYLRHALKFPRVQAIVYATRSCYEAENEALVTKAVQFAQVTRATKGIPFRVTPPVLPFTFDEIDSGKNGIDDRYIRFHPSDRSNGCFIAVISREPEDTKDGARSMFSMARSRRYLTKTRSTPLPSEDVNTKDSDSSSWKSQKPGKGRKLKAAMSTPEVKAGISSKLAGHNSPVGVGARLYQAGLVHKMEQRAKQRHNKLEQLTAPKQPSPFSPTPGSDNV
ncbi:hypothetical protein BsWGS_18081 [Bradybaena similaris]